MVKDLPFLFITILTKFVRSDLNEKCYVFLIFQLIKILAEVKILSYVSSLITIL